MKPVFSGLPNELILQIWSHVLEPKDVESFALASRNVYALASKFIEEHRRLKNRYSVLYHAADLRGSRPAEFLAEVLLNPRAALYVDEIALYGWKLEWDDPATLPLVDISDCHLPYPKDNMQLLEEAVKTSAFIPESEAESWISEIRAGDEGNILALIVSLLPNVKRFTLEGGLLHEGNRLPELIGRIGKSPVAAALSRLTDVKLGWTDTEIVCLDFAWVQTFSSLRSVKAIRGEGVGQFDEGLEVWYSLPPRWSNVTNLHLDCCNIDFKRLPTYFQCVAGLQTFSYAAASQDSPFDPFWLCASLAHVAHSLKTLHVSSSDGKGRHMGSLAGLKVLAELSTEYRMLLDYNAELEDEKLMQMLPSSIEKVTLRHDACYNLEELHEQILGMCKLKADGLPNLKVLTYEIDTLLKFISGPVPRQSTEDYMDDSAKIAALKQRSMDVGVELSIRQLD